MVDPENIFTELYVQYIDRSEETFINVTFHKEERSGDLLELNGDATVMAEGTELTSSSSQPWNYTTTLQGYYDTLQIDYRDHEGNLYQYQIDMTQVNSIAFPAGFNNLGITENQVLNWSGEPITQEEESVQLEFGKSGVDFRRISESTIDATSLTIQSRDLMTFGATEIDMLLYRGLELDLENAPPAGGAVVLAYSTGIVPVTLRFED